MNNHRQNTEVYLNSFFYLYRILLYVDRTQSSTLIFSNIYQKLVQLPF